MNKKAIELPISMIVVLILSIMMFTFGTVMIFKFFKGATEASQQIDKATQNQINAILREGNELVALPKILATARIGQDATFALGIRNIYTSREFVVVIGHAGAYYLDDTKIIEADTTTMEYEWLKGFKKQENIQIQQNKFVTLPLRIRIGDYMGPNSKTQKGLYVFNACVFDIAPGEPRPQEFNCDTSSPSAVQSTIHSTYDNKIRQVTIRVV